MVILGKRSSRQESRERDGRKYDYPAWLEHKLPQSVQTLEQSARDGAASEQWKLIPHSSGGLELESKVPAWSNSGERPVPGCRLQTFCCIFTWWKGQGSAQESFSFSF